MGRITSALLTEFSGEYQRSSAREALAVIGAFGTVAVATTWPLVLRLGDALPDQPCWRAAAEHGDFSPGMRTGCCTACRGGGICQSSIPTPTCLRSRRT